MPISRHTPGLWTAHNRQGQREDRWVIVGHAMERPLLLAELVTGAGGAPATQIAANARLMTAAPRLLESLRVLALLVRRHIAAAGQHGQIPDRRLLLTLCAAANAAVDAADGPDA